MACWFRREKNGTLSVYVVSDRVQPAEAELRVRVVDFQGNIVNEKLQAVTVLEPCIASVRNITDVFTVEAEVDGTLPEPEVLCGEVKVWVARRSAIIAGHV